MGSLFQLLFPSYPTYQVFLSLAISLVLCVVITPVWVKFVKRWSIGQVVRTDGPPPHLEKHGTPTMGGIVMLAVVAFTYLLVAQARGYSPYGILALCLTAACGLVGFIDDLLMVVRVRSLGLRARDKLILLLVISVGFGYLALLLVDLPTTIGFPGTNAIHLGVGYLLFLYVVVTATTNSVNLTDGLDGLAAGTVAIVVLALGGIAFREDLLDLAIFAAAVGGACIGFLWYNVYPAEIFMGDTGSFALGGAIAGLAVLTKTELLLILIGGVYALETLSVITQIIAYRRFGLRVFKMAPIHHHFEIIGWSETKVMLRFWILTAAFAGLGFSVYFTAG